MVERREVLGAAAGVVTLVLPAAAAAASGDGDTAAALTVNSTLGDDQSATVAWNDSGT